MLGGGGHRDMGGQKRRALGIDHLDRRAIGFGDLGEEIDRQRERRLAFAHRGRRRESGIEQRRLAGHLAEETPTCVPTFALQKDVIERRREADL